MGIASLLALEAPSHAMRHRVSKQRCFYVEYIDNQIHCADDLLGGRFASTRGFQGNSNNGQINEPAYQNLPSLDVRPSGLNAFVPSNNYPDSTIAASPLLSASRPSGVPLTPLFSEPGGGDGGDSVSAKRTGDGDDGLNITGIISYTALYAGIVAAAFVVNSLFFSPKRQKLALAK